MKTSKKNSARLISIALSLVFFVGAAWLFFNRQYAVDQLAVWQYTPSAEVAAIADAAQLNDRGKFYFYATHPQLDGTSNFNKSCTRQEKGSAVLGCYVHNNIYIFDVTDARLQGVKEVTAAHETLHAVYSRLSDAERKRVDGLLEVEYKKINDKELKERMDYYARTEPGQQNNELHSIIATEYDSISDELEAYYSTFFHNRKAVVALHDSYSKQFNQRTDKREQLGRELDRLAATIKKMSKDYNSGVKELNNDINNFNNRAKAGEFNSQAQFNGERNGLLDRNDKLATMRKAINSKIGDYEKIRIEYNTLVDESNSLQKSLDSLLAPAPEV